MREKMRSGSILVCCGILAQVFNYWLKHIFVTLFYIGKGTLLSGGGRFSTLPDYEGLNDLTRPRWGEIKNPYLTFIIWITIVIGFLLIFLDFIEEKEKNKS